MSRRLAREIAFKTLFQQDIGKNEMEPAMSELLAESGLGEEYARFARKLAAGVLEHGAALDEILSQHLVNWKMNRLAAVDRNVLRLAAYELLYCDDIPMAVTINEALELSKAFNTDESAKFLNGVLDKLARKHKGNEVE